MVKVVWRNITTQVVTTMRVSAWMIFLIVLAVSACSSNTASYKKKPPERAKPVTELNLNLPGKEHACYKPDLSDQSFLDKGLDALEQGAYIESLSNFKKQLQSDKSQSSELNAKLAINYLIFIPSSPVHDLKEAKKMYRQLRKQLTTGVVLDRRVGFIKESMEAFLLLEKHIAALEEKNVQLNDDLKKREEALKRLRDLTLGS